MILVITENIHLAIAAADAHAGIFSEKENAYVYSDTLPEEKLLARGYIATRINGADSIIFWKGDKLSAKLNNLKEENVREICMFLFPLPDSVRIISNLKERFPKAMFTYVRPFSTEKADLVSAFSRPVPLKESYMLTDMKAIELTGIELIGKRTSVKKNASFRILADIPLSDTVIHARSENLYEEAPAMRLSGKEGVLTLDEKGPDGFSDIFYMHRIYDQLDYERGLLSACLLELYINGAISFPVTSGRYLPSYYKGRKLEELFSLLELDESYTESITPLYSERSSDFGIIPLREPSGCSKRSRIAFSIIKDAAARAIKESKSPVLHFSGPEKGMLFLADLSNGTVIPRGKTSFECTFSCRQEGCFSDYSPQEFVTSLAKDFPAGACAGICDYLDSQRYIYINTDGIHLNKNGRKLHSSVPPQAIEEAACNTEEMPPENEDLFAGKELVISGFAFTLTKSDIESIRNTGLSTFKVSINGGLRYRGYLEMRNGNLLLSEKSPYSCPFCNNPMNTADWGFYCESCTFSVPFEIYGKAISPQNLKELLQGKRTSVIRGLMGPSGAFDASVLIDADSRLHLFRK